MEEFAVETIEAAEEMDEEGDECYHDEAYRDEYGSCQLCCLEAEVDAYGYENLYE